jgi:hypothetical protein
MKRRDGDQKEHDVGGPSRLFSFAIKCSAVEEVILQNVFKSEDMTLAEFAQLSSFLLMRASFRNPQAEEIPEDRAQERKILGLITQLYYRIGGDLDDRTNQVSAISEKLSKAVSEASLQKAHFEIERQEKQPEFVSINSRALWLDFENSVLMESLRLTSKVALLHERAEPGKGRPD